MVTQIIYNGAVIGTVEPGETKLIKCNDKKMTGDLEIRAGERTEIKYGGTIIAIVEAGDSKVIKCAGKTMKSNIEIRVEDGKSGTDGFSPTVELIDISGGTRLVITDINGEKSADIMDGKDGKDGTIGKNGSDGVGIKSVVQTTTSSADGGSNVITVTKTDNTTSTFTVKNGSKGSKGDTGAQGIQGIQGEKGADGAKGDKGDKGDTGATGAAGKDGTSVTVKSVSESTADGGSNVVTFSDGKTLTVKNGSKGSAGKDGSDGQDGADGKTPVKGVDYFTEADKSEFSEYIASELAKRGQLAPAYPEGDTVDEALAWLAENGDQTKMYVLPDGMIYAWMYKEVAVGGYTNMVDPSSSDFNATKRYNASGAITTGGGSTGFVSNMFDIKAGDVLYIKGVTGSTSTSATAPIFVAAKLKSDGSNVMNSHAMYLAQPLGATVATGQQAWNAIETLTDGTVKWTYAVNNAGSNTAPKSANGSADAVKTRIAGVATNGFDNIIVTVNEEIREPEVIKQYQWASTGHAFVPADYENRIIALEAEDTEIREEIAIAKAETDEAIAELQEQIDSGAASAKSGARWFALGDSITEGWTSAVDASASNGYKQFLNTNVAERWVNIVAEKNGYELTNHGIGGTGYLKGDTNNARLLADTLDFSQCDFVTLAYGVNDWKFAVNIGSMNDDITAGGSMVANMRYVIKKILADNPYCKIFVITPINCRSYGTYDTNYGINYKGGTTGALNGLGLQDIFDRMKEVCDYHGIELIDVTHSSVVNRENITTVLADYVHPTVECHKAMARELAKKINFL